MNRIPRSATPPSFADSLLLVLALVTAGVLLGPAPGPCAETTGRVLSDAEWLADVDQIVTSIREVHPDPFRAVDEATFEVAAAELRAAIPSLDDRLVIVRLAELVALLGDGHTRLFLPRQHAELAPALEVGHSGTDPPADPALELSQLPLRFGLFSDGLFITHATASLAPLVGRRVSRIGDLEVASAIEAAGATIGGNDARRRALVVDRLALPAVLSASGVPGAAERVSLRVLDGSGDEEEVEIEPLGRDGVMWRGGRASIPVSERHPESKAWFELLPDWKAVYVRVDELEASPDEPWSRFVARTLDAAARAGSERYVLDLRANAGGSGSWVTPFVNGLAGSPYDHYGRLMVLIGGSTFSAAQMLVNELERYTDACFVGEPSGAPPTHFGDSRKIVLDNSGLTLRVASLFWPNWLAGDFRRATSPHVDAAPSCADYFGGRDPALEVALTYRPAQGAAAQVEDLLRRDRTQAAILRFMRYISNPRVERLDVGPFVASGHRLLDDGLFRQGQYVFILSGDYLPASARVQTGWGRAMELAGEPQEAVGHYQKALALDPEQSDAREALLRLAPLR